MLVVTYASETLVVQCDPVSQQGWQWKIRRHVETDQKSSYKKVERMDPGLRIVIKDLLETEKDKKIVQCF